ncbi:MAG: putative DNA binding domain-containing protein [Deltaproteobacteria bacterium]|nr:putative DNA binding domain-containing protein [Deltaproteobacteria bacterium]
MTTTPARLGEWLEARETEHLEFKEARNGFNFDDVKRYVAALANEGGGHLVLGVTRTMPRVACGSQAFGDLNDLKHRLYQVFRRRIDVEALDVEGKRVVVISAPARPRGEALQVDGAYLMRAGESLVPMTGDQLRRIFDETTPDVSTEGTLATFADLDPAAIATLLRMWAQKSADAGRTTMAPADALRDLGLLQEGKVTRAALILLGSPQALRQHQANAELIWEFRHHDAAIEHDRRLEWRQPFLLVLDQVWGAIASRNDVEHLQEGLFMRDIPVLREDVVREAVLNAVCHRDYRVPGSVFITQWPRRLVVESPGGLPPGVTVENIVSQRQPRNRLLAETLQHLGLVERSGQGMDKMFRSTISDGKPPPDFAGTDEHRVVLTLNGSVQDPRFLQFLERVGQETLATFSATDFILLDHVRRGAPVPELARSRIGALIEQGVVERVGKKLILSKRLYAFLGERGTYTRKRGLDRETQKALLEKHLREVAAADGARLEELRQVLGPATRGSHTQNLLRELKREGRAHLVGRTNAARWYPGPAR